jgi:hypothetical protein
MTDTDQSASPFGPPLSEDVVFEAAVLRRPLHGRREADAALQAAGGYYASNVPIRKTVDGDRTRPAADGPFALRRAGHRAEDVGLVERGQDPDDDDG